MTNPNFFTALCFIILGSIVSSPMKASDDGPKPTTSRTTSRHDLEIRRTLLAQNQRISLDCIRLIVEYIISRPMNITIPRPMFTSQGYCDIVHKVLINDYNHHSLKTFIIKTSSTSRDIDNRCYRHNTCWTEYELPFAISDALTTNDKRYDRSDWWSDRTEIRCRPTEIPLSYRSSFPHHNTVDRYSYSHDGWDRYGFPASYTIATQKFSQRGYRTYPFCTFTTKTGQGGDICLDIEFNNKTKLERALERAINNESPMIQPANNAPIPTANAGKLSTHPITIPLNRLTEPEERRQRWQRLALVTAIGSTMAAVYWWNRAGKKSEAPVPQ